MVKFLIVRHGHSLGNEQNLITGLYDCDLSKTGYNQGNLVCDYIIKNIKVDAFYSSDLIRAVNTIKPAADALGLPINLEPDFRELGVGIWDGMPFDDIPKLYPEEFEAWTNKEPNFAPEGGETWENLVVRSTTRLRELGEQNDGKTIIIATHGGVIKVLLECFSGAAQNDLEWVSNASITEIWYENGQFEIKKVSFDDYLGELTTELPKSV